LTAMRAVEFKALSLIIGRALFLIGGGIQTFFNSQIRS
jgi:hypothetical protein